MRIAVRAAVFARDGWVCQARTWGEPCFGPLTVHHVRKSSQGGEFTVDNLVSLCARHNERVEDFPDEAYAMGLVTRRGDALLVSQPTRRFGPRGDSRPVPAGPATDDPVGLGHQPALAPHVDRVGLDAKPVCDVLGADGITDHTDSMRRTVTLDKSDRPAVHSEAAKAKRPAPDSTRGTPTSRPEEHSHVVR